MCALAVALGFAGRHGVDAAELVDAHLKLDQQVMDARRKTKVPVVPT
jgi:hypothetical protein